MHPASLDKPGTYETIAGSDPTDESVEISVPSGVRQEAELCDAWLEEHNPEVAIMVLGTNDLGELDIEDYETKTRRVVEKCLDNGTVVILSTIPPRRGREGKAAKFAGAVRRIARDLKVPMTDYHAEILKRRPDDRDGATEMFSGMRVTMCRR